MNSPIAVAYVFHGQDEPTLRERLAAFCRDYSSDLNTDMNVARLDGRSLRLADIETSAATLPFLAETRLVLIDNLTESPAIKTLLEEIKALIPRLPGWSRVVFIETNLQNQPQESQNEGRRKVSRRTAIKQLVDTIEHDPRGKVFAFEPPNNTARWVQDRAQKHGVAIDPTAAAQLANRIGENFVLADIELQKLAAYTNWARPIMVEDVDALTPYTPEANIFNMVDALGKRDGKVALNLLRQLIEEGDEPLRIFGMIIRQYRLLLQMREQLDEGSSVRQAGQTLGMKDYPAQKIGEQAKQYTLSQLDRVYHLLLETDMSIKTGQQDPAIALEMLVARLAR
ncbi:MAG: DNA polymerase III subunit delta [Anaerolineae bacterium]|nr:DNA polymerase III subunit delta [Anaerolineae bacterium]